MITSQSPYSLKTELHSLNNLLNTLYPENRSEDKEVAQVKKILGIKAEQYTPEQIKELITKIQYLIQSWLDDYERSIFKGQTLQELLSSKKL